MKQSIDIRNEFLDMLRPLKEGLWKYCLSMNREKARAEKCLSQAILEAFADFEKSKKKDDFKIRTFAKTRKICASAPGNRIGDEPEIAEYYKLICTDPDPSRSEEIALLFSTIDKLNDRHKQVLVLIEIIGLTPDEVGRIIGTDLDSVYKCLSECRHELAIRMSAETKPIFESDEIRD